MTPLGALQGPASLSTGWGLPRAKHSRVSPERVHPSRPPSESSPQSYTYDVFLTHDWGEDEHGRSNHKRVGMVNDALKQRGIDTWCRRPFLTPAVTDPRLYACGAYFVAMRLACAGSTKTGWKATL